MENASLISKAQLITSRPRPPMVVQSKKMSSAAPPPGGLSLQHKLLCAGTAACIADMITFPLDTAKVRLQVQGESTPVNGIRYNGMFGTLKTICATEGPRGMYSGIVPGLQRQMCFASVRIGLYDTVKQTYVNLFNADPSKPNIGLRILAGITTGGSAVLCAQPTDVVKVRMQAASVGSAKRYSGVFNAYKTIAVKEGVRGLWKGTSANVTRNAVVNASELVSYDLIKESLLHYTAMKDNIYCHFVSAFGAGFCTTVVASPVDVVKTRFMNSSAGQYSGVINCAVRMYKSEGPMAFYKGFMPSYMRLGTWNIAMFICYEQLKRIASTPAPQIDMPSIEINKGKQLL